MHGAAWEGPAQITPMVPNMRRTCVGLQQQQHEGGTQQCPCTKCFPPVLPKRGALQFMPLYQCDVHLLRQFWITQSFFLYSPWNIQIECISDGIRLFFFAIVVKYFIPPPPPYLKVHSITSHWQRWLFLTWNDWRKSALLFKQVYEHRQLFCFPGVGDKQSSASAGRSAVCWPSESKHAIFFPYLIFPFLLCFSPPCLIFWGNCFVLPFILNCCLPCLPSDCFHSFRVPPFSSSGVSNPECP